MTPNLEEIFQLLKSELYHNSDNLFIRQLIAEYVSDNKLEIDKLKFEKICNELYLENCNFEKCFKTWFNKIKYCILPKKINANPELLENYKDINHANILGKFITNETDSEEYSVDGINFFILPPVFFLFFDILWVTEIGKYLDREISHSCYANRVDFGDKEENNANYHLFRYFVPQYSKWRDSAIQTAETLLDDGKNIALLLMDIKGYYYHVDIDFDKLLNDSEFAIKKYKNEIQDKDRLFISNLNQFLKLFYLNYTDLIKKYLLHTNNIDEKQKSVLPIGLFSSKILANWYLKEFDDLVTTNLNPSYYGRYVDDMIIVIQNPSFSEIKFNNEVETSNNKNNERNIQNFFLRYFINSNLLNFKVIDSKNGKIIERFNSICKSKNLLECVEILKSDEKLIDFVENFKENFNKSQFELEYYINKYPNLKIQSKKLVLHFLDKDYSKALISKIKEQLRLNSSAFRYLPDKDLESQFDEYSYQLLYTESTNKLRNIGGISLNSQKLAVNLIKTIDMYSICNDDDITLKNIFQQIVHFFKGENYFNHYTKWEKIFSLLIIKERDDDIYNFYREISASINKIINYDAIKDKNVKIEILKKLRENLEEYLALSISIPLGLLSINQRDSLSEKLNSETIYNLSDCFRSTFFIRERYVSFPLINYTGYSGSLLDSEFYRDEFFKDENNWEISENIKKTPRFIHLWEYQLFYVMKQITLDLFCHDEDCLEPIKQYINDMYFGNEGKFYTHHQILKPNIHKISFYNQNNEYCVPFQTKDLNNQKEKKQSTIKSIKNPNDIISIIPIWAHKSESLKIKVGIANLQVKESDIDTNLCPISQPNCSSDRLDNIFRILNLAKENQCELLIFPELSIPHSWLKYLIDYSRRHQMAIIFGVEHILVNSLTNSGDDLTRAYNILVVSLPYSIKDEYKSCNVSFRLKNHYSPLEIETLKRYRYNIPENENPIYHKYNWKGINFSVYNCFELADICHRSIFKSKIDLLVGCTFNKDINYFSNIIESVSRDLHCFSAFVNTSTYGLSRIIQPTNNEEINIAQIGGGINSAVLVGELNIEELRKFQVLNYLSSDKRFKPLPPGFNQDCVIQRSNKNN